MIKAHRE